MKGTERGYSSLSKKRLRGLVAGVLVGSCLFTHPAEANPVESDVPSKETIAHLLLRLDRDCLHQVPNGSGDDEWFRTAVVVLESLLAKAAATIAALGISDWIQADAEAAEAALESIDRTLAEEGFVVCVKTSLLSDAFGPPVPLGSAQVRMISTSEGSCHIALGHDYRKKALEKHWRIGVRPIDCDLGVALYLAIADREGLPLTSVRSPGHNFIRWHLPDGTYFNWDSNDGRRYSDPAVRSGAPLTAPGFDAVEEELNSYLADEHRDSFVAYYASIVASSDRASRCALKLFDEHLPAADHNSTTLNNFAWAFSTQARFRDERLIGAAVRLAEVATSLQPTCNNWDTLSCAYAAAGRFGEAISIERRYVTSSSPRIPYYEAARSCYEPIVRDAGGC